VKFLDGIGRYSIYFVEFVGTFFLTVTIGLTTVSINTTRIAPLAIGSVLMACVFAGGHISGAHYNPAITFGIWLTGRGKITTRQSMGYVVVQLFGGFCAGLAHWEIAQETTHLAPGNSVSDGHAVSAEILYTYLLVSVVLNVATTRKNSDNSFYGLAIGFTVLGGAVGVGSISGGAFNPAVGTGLVLADALNNGSDRLRPLWIYWVGPLLGGLCAAIAFRITTHHSEYQTADVGAVVESEEDAVAKRRAEKDRRAAAARHVEGGFSVADAPLLPGTPTSES